MYILHKLFQTAERKAWTGKKEDMGREWTQRQSTSDPENGVLTFEQGSNCPKCGNDVLISEQGSNCPTWGNDVLFFEQGSNCPTCGNDVLIFEQGSSCPTRGNDSLIFEQGSNCPKWGNDVLIFATGIKLSYMWQLRPELWTWIKLPHTWQKCPEAEIYRNYCATNSAWPEVELRFSPWLLQYCLNIEQVGLTWALLFVSIICISTVVMADKWEGAFSWPMAFSHLSCDAQTPMRLHSGARPKVSLKSQGLRLNTRTQKMTKNSATALCPRGNMESQTPIYYKG